VGAPAYKRSQNASPNVETFNNEAGSLEGCSTYQLFPQERVLFRKYYQSGQRVLDLACGAGRATLRLWEMGLAVKGIDLSEFRLATAQRRFPYLHFELGDYCELREPDESFDHVLISFNGLDYTHPEVNRERAIRNCVRVLRRGGTFIFSSHNLKSLYFSPWYFRDWKELKFKLRHTLTAVREKAYLYNRGNRLLVFHASPDYVIRQTKPAGFDFVEMLGFRNSGNRLFNTYCSLWNHYVFRKP